MRYPPVEMAAAVALQARALNEYIRQYTPLLQYRYWCWRYCASFSCTIIRLTMMITFPPDICRPYLATADRAVRAAVYRILGVSLDAQTLDQLNYAKRQLSLPAEFGGLNVPSLELDAEPAHYASFTGTLANLVTDYESECTVSSDKNY
jgi:hypothetical protein